MSAAGGEGALGVILAGGENRRYGAAKALAEVGGRRILDRVREALEAAVPEVVLVANDPEPYASAGLPQRPDVWPGQGALGGILTALVWARERGCRGALVVACDMPFVSAALLGELLEWAGRGVPAPDVVAPESGGRRGVEPLCAWYGVSCLAAVERALEHCEQQVVSFYEDVRVERVPLDVVHRFGDPARLFLNVNTVAERERAERLAAEEPSP